jgi:hypothetical protein
MKWLHGDKMGLVLVGFVVAIVLGCGSARADFTFGKPTNLGPTVNGSSGDADGYCSADGLTLYFDSDRPNGIGDWDIWITTRPTVNDSWEEPINPGSAVNSPYEDGMPCISSDGLELYFYSKRPGGYGGIDFWVAERTNLSDPWGTAVNLGAPVNSSSHDFGLSLSEDGLELYFSSRRPGGLGSDDIWVTKRGTKDAPWGEPVNLGPLINSPASDLCSSISANSLVLFFSSHGNGPFPSGGNGAADIWITTRATRNDPWKPPFNPGPPLNTSYAEANPYISADGGWLYFCDWGPHRPGGYGSDDLWQAPIIPTVDFTGDYQVDIEDLTILIEHWGQNEPAYDMGPMAWGDGVIDKADLDVLMSYWGQEVYNPHLLAHWKLDETEGDVAYDSATDNDAVVIGKATWGPDNGTVDGALQLDGIDDYIDTLFKLDPADGEFSIFAWVKGGAPGQVILSQEGGEDWLLADADTGCLKTEVEATGRGSGLLCSETIITDGNWHCIGLVWDGTHRTLYVGDLVVATDPRTPGALKSINGSLYLGTEANLEPGTFWSGMIDDVRIYDRVVKP